MRWAAMAAGCVVVLALAVWGAHWRTLHEIERALPPLPSLEGRPAELRERLKAADATVRQQHSTAALVELAKLYHINGYFDRAEACWQTLRQISPREGKWAYYLADLRRTAGDEAGLETDLREAAALAPTYPTVWLRLADLEFKSGRLDEAKSSYDRRLALLPGDPYARLGLARIALQHERRDEARATLESLVRERADFSPSLNLYAELLEAAGDEKGATQMRFRSNEAGRFREADDPWIEALYPYCYDPQKLAILGTIDAQTKHGDRGRGYLERALNLAPRDRAVAKALSNLYLTLGDLEQAKAMLDRTIPLISPPEPILYVNRCEVARLQRQPEDALRQVDEALRILPQAYQLHNERGAILGDLGRLEESRVEYQAAVDLAPTDTDSNYSLGITLLALGRRAEAITYIKRSQTLQPTYPKALMMLGRLELEAGHLAAAETYIRTLFQLHQDQEQAKKLMALWYLRSGEAAAAQHDETAAAAAYRAGFALDATNGALGLNLGTLCLTQGNPAEALAPLETFHRAAPKDPQGFLFLGQTYAQLGRLPEARAILTQGEAEARAAGRLETASFCREILAHLP